METDMGQTTLESFLAMMAAFSYKQPGSKSRKRMAFALGNLLLRHVAYQCTPSQIHICTTGILPNERSEIENAIMEQVQPAADNIRETLMICRSDERLTDAKIFDSLEMCSAARQLAPYFGWTQVLKTTAIMERQYFKRIMLAGLTSMQPRILQQVFHKLAHRHGPMPTSNQWWYWEPQFPKIPDLMLARTLADQHGRITTTAAAI